MAITLKQAFSLNGTPDLTSFKDLQAQCKNPNYFTDSNPINKLSSWEGYWYGTGDYKISLSSSTSSVAASGGSVTITYTIKQVTSTGETPLSGVKPSITSSLGTVGTINSTNSSGQGTCTVSISSLGCSVKAETTITVSGSYSGASASASFKQAANSKTTISWNNPTISTFSYNNISACSTTANPIISYSQTGTQSYTSGTCTTTVTQSSGATISYSETTAHSAASVNSSTGVVTWGSNAKNSSSRSVGITATVTMNGKSVSKATTSTQDADSYTDGIEYGSWTGGAISFSKTTLGAGADSAVVTIQPWSRAKNTIRTWTCGGRVNIGSTTDYYTGTVSVSENGSYTSLDSASYTASSSAKTLTLTKNTCGYTSVSATSVTITADPATDGPSTTSNSINQAANVVSTSTEYQVSAFSVSPTSGSYDSGSFTASATIQKRSKTTSTANSTPSYGSWSAAANVKPTISSNSSWCTVGTVGSSNSSGVSTTTISYGQNSGSARIATLTATYGTSKTATFTQGTAPNIWLKAETGCKSWIGVNLDIEGQNFATGDADNTGEYAILGTFANWTSMPSGNIWSANINLNDYSTTGCSSNNFTAKFYLYDSVGNVMDSSLPISGSCNSYVDTLIEWSVGRDNNSNIARMIIEVEFS